VRLPPEAWDRVFQLAVPAVPRALRVRLPGDKIHKLAGVLSLQAAADLYVHLVSSWKTPTRVVIGGDEPPSRVNSLLSELQGTFTEQMMFADALTYLPDDILVKVDRASMGVSLETRVPMLDPDVATFAWRLPLAYKTRKSQGKIVLRKLLHRYVPSALVERPKMGFGVPVDLWLRGPLRSWAEDLLSYDRLKQQRLFDASIVQHTWDEHLSGERNWVGCLWPILMFEAWTAGQAFPYREPSAQEGSNASASSF
jgi:asparagine synthase (glutamine-hydrolysing)